MTDQKTKNAKISVGILVLGRERPGFSPGWGDTILEKVKSYLENSKFACLYPSQKAVDDQSLRKSVSELKDKNADVLITLQPTMSDGRLAPILAQIWKKPIVLWGTPEDPGANLVTACSLVGQHTFGATLAQLGLPFEIVYADPERPEMTKRLEDAVYVASASTRLKNAKVGLIGYHAPGFIDMHTDPADLSRFLGAQLYHYGIDEFVEKLQNIGENRVNEDVKKVKEMGLPFDDAEEKDLELNSRYYLAMRDLFERENLQTLSIREWSELTSRFGQWPYLAVSRLAGEGKAVSIEGDTGGALSRFVIEELGKGPVYLGDWLYHEDDFANLWHGGAIPLQMCETIGTENGPSLGKHFNSGTPLVVNAHIKTNMPVTVTRLWHYQNGYRMMAFEGKTIEPRENLLGTNCVVKTNEGNVHDIFDRMCHAAMPHHVAVCEGNHKDLFKRFARQMDMEWVE
jgi:L-fucose isomerase-like protein